jgi:hypothetical protein
VLKTRPVELTRYKSMEQLLMLEANKEKPKQIANGQSKMTRGCLYVGIHLLPTIVG